MAREDLAASIEPLPPEIKSIQPGGGVCMRIELAWGHWRRWYLKTFRRRYLADMLAKREGTHNACPHEVLDPRDLKFYRNQGGYSWSAANDPFAWRDRLPFARAGLAELMILSGATMAVTVALAIVYQPLAIGPGLVGLCIVWFFRNPRRIVPSEPGAVVSPADGHIACIEDVDDEFIGEPAVLVGIFLSIFDVHINRSSMDATVGRSAISCPRCPVQAARNKARNMNHQDAKIFKVSFNFLLSLVTGYYPTVRARY